MAARARGVVGVAVAVDLVEVDALALGELVASGRCHPDLADRITIAPVELPRRDVGQGAQDRPGDGAGLVVADHGDADTVVVEPERVRALDQVADPTGPALPDPAEPVDQEVVADVEMAEE